MQTDLKQFEKTVKEVSDEYFRKREQRQKLLLIFAWIAYLAIFWTVVIVLIIYS